MKIMTISDIHGESDKLDTVISIYNLEKCKKLFILGDFFNYFKEKNNKDIISKLNKMKSELLCVKGNCDFDTSSLEVTTPLIERVNIDGTTYTLTHGHAYDKNYLLDEDSNIILTGHTHVNNIEKIDDKLFVNPGSISKSRKGPNSFSIIDNNTVTIRDLDNKILDLYKIK